MGVPEQEVLVSGTVREVSGGRVIVDTVAEQAGKQIIRNAEAELQVA
jgi:FKBP-type peptidyl-prolyl cis-trans isomerase 2